MSPAIPHQEELLKTGRVWMREALSQAEIACLRNLSATTDRPGARFAADDPLFQAVRSAGFSRKLERWWPRARPVRVLGFDKAEEVNWQLPWHQDRVIAVRDKVEIPGYSRWSRKAGIWHCEPPTAVLEKMLFVRVHLDTNTRETGAMEIALGSHRKGNLSKAKIAECIGRFDTEVTEAKAGDVLVLSMLTVHRSLRATAPAARRVLRIDYASQALPAPLDWAA